MAHQRKRAVFEDWANLPEGVLDTDTLLVSLHAVNSYARVSPSDGGPQTEGDIANFEEASRRLAGELGVRLTRMRFAPVKFPTAEWGDITLYVIKK